MIELPDLAARLCDRFPQIGEFELQPHATASGDMAVALHLKGPILDQSRMIWIARVVEHDPEFRVLGISHVKFSLCGDRVSR